MVSIQRTGSMEREVPDQATGDKEAFPEAPQEFAGLQPNRTDHHRNASQSLASSHITHILALS